MITRRQFLEDSILATASAAVAVSAAPVFAKEAPVAANETINVAILGCGIRGKQHVDELAPLPGCRIAYVCDPDQERVDALIAGAEKRTGYRPKGERDLRKIIDDKSIDAVFVATCNHWHALSAIWAMQAGKDVYCEKPVSHNIWEGRRIVEVARKTGRICQTGTQNRSNTALAAAVQYMREGRLGAVKLARSIIYGRRESVGGPGKYEVPASVDYNLWAGPAPMSPLTRPKLHYEWHWFWETGNGELANNNIHMADICRWGLGVTGLGRAVLSYGGRFGYRDAAETPNTQVVIHDFGDKTIVQETRGLKTEDFNPTLKGGYLFYGAEGIIASAQRVGPDGKSGGMVTSLFDPAGKFVSNFEGGQESHFANFLDAVRSRNAQLLHADILEGHQSTALCHAGNISYRIGRAASSAEIRSALQRIPVHVEDSLETLARTEKHLADNGVDLNQTPLTLGSLLEVDGTREAFVANDRANSLLKREYRKPFVVPAESETSAG